MKKVILGILVLVLISTVSYTQWDGASGRVYVNVTTTTDLISTDSAYITDSLSVTNKSTLSGNVMVQDTLIISKGVNTNPPADSLGYFTVTSGQPIFGLKAAAGDAWTISVNDNDQGVFAGASNGYTFAGAVNVTGNVIGSANAILAGAVNGATLNIDRKSVV